MANFWSNMFYPAGGHSDAAPPQSFVAAVTAAPRTDTIASILSNGHTKIDEAIAKLKGAIQTRMRELNERNAQMRKQITEAKRSSARGTLSMIDKRRALNHLRICKKLEASIVFMEDNVGMLTERKMGLDEMEICRLLMDTHTSTLRVSSHYGNKINPDTIDEMETHYKTAILMQAEIKTSMQNITDTIEASSEPTNTSEEALMDELNEFLAETEPVESEEAADAMPAASSERTPLLVSRAMRKPNTGLMLA